MERVGPITPMDRMKIRAPDIADNLCSVLLSEACEMILTYTGRTELPSGLEAAMVQLALVLYNRMGIEGETAHSEGGVSRSMESLPADIRAQLTPYRLAKVVNMHATTRA